MSEFIFNPTSKYSEESAPQDASSEYFTLLGLEDFTDPNQSPRVKEENDKVFAKKHYRKDGSIKYTIKLNNSGKLYNPVSIYGQEQNNTFLNRVCRSNNKFAEVNQKVFDWYVKFLKTKNVAWLTNAERENE